VPRKFSTAMSYFIFVMLFTFLGAAIFMLAPNASHNTSTGAVARTDVILPTDALPVTSAATALPQPTQMATPTPDLMLSFTPGIIDDMPKDIEEEPSPRVPNPTDPYNLYITGERVTDIDLVVRQSSLIVLGTIVEVQPPRWTTKDGERPENPWNRQYGIFTPVIVRIDQSVKGGVSETYVSLWGCGGVIGVDSEICENESSNGVGANSFQVGQRVVVFLTSGGTLDVTAPYIGIRDRYTILDNDMAVNIHREI
jgi:hypothetical protein